MTNKELREKVKEIVLHDSDVDKIMALFEQVKSSGWGDVRIDQEKKKEQLKEYVQDTLLVGNLNAATVPVEVHGAYFHKEVADEAGRMRIESVTQAPNLEEIKKKFEANLLDGDKVESDGNMLSARVVLDFFAPLLATKEHDEELLREFGKWADGNGAVYSNPKFISDWVAEFIASRKVSSLGEGK